VGVVRPTRWPPTTLRSCVDSRWRETVAPAHGQLRNRCRSCGTAPSDHDGSQPAFNESPKCCHRPVSFQCIWAVFPTRSDPTGTGTAVSRRSLRGAPTIEILPPRCAVFDRGRVAGRSLRAPDQRGSAPRLPSHLLQVPITSSVEGRDEAGIGTGAHMLEQDLNVRPSASFKRPVRRASATLSICTTSPLRSRRGQV